MCLILFSYKSHPNYHLVVAANRDEYYSRPTHPLSFWVQTPEILAGQDLQGQGTWLGITRSGRFAAVTNYREPHKNGLDSPSRGFLIRRFLEDTSDPETYLKKIDSEKHVYDGFNMLAGDQTALYYLSNRNSGNPTGVLKLESGIYGLSNRLLDTPWPKVKKGKSVLKTLLNDALGVQVESIFKLLSDRSHPPDNDMPDTGVGLVWERILSPLFIISDYYGTRSSSVVLVEKMGKVTFVERTFVADASGVKSFSTCEYTFQITG